MLASFAWTIRVLWTTSGTRGESTFVHRSVSVLLVEFFRLVSYSTPGRLPHHCREMAAMRKSRMRVALSFHPTEHGVSTAKSNSVVTVCCAREKAVQLTFSVKYLGLCVLTNHQSEPWVFPSLRWCFFSVENYVKIGNFTVKRQERQEKCVDGIWVGFACVQMWLIDLLCVDSRSSVWEAS